MRHFDHSIWNSDLVLRRNGPEDVQVFILCCCLQVYPTLVIRGTGLYELWKKGLYRNYDPVQLVDLVARILSLVPPWVRIYRIQASAFLPSLTSCSACAITSA